MEIKSDSIVSAIIYLKRNWQKNWAFLVRVSAYGKIIKRNVCGNGAAVRVSALQQMEQSGFSAPVSADEAELPVGIQL